MSAERKVEPSAWMAHDSLGQPTFETHGMSGGQPLYTLDASRLVWAERLEERATVLECVDDAIGPNYHEAQALRTAARWLRSQDGAR
jgi:hypothetical protein